MNGFGDFANGIAGFSQEMEYGHAQIANLQNPRSQTVAADRMPVLVQNAVLDVVQAVLHLPVTASQRLKLNRQESLRIKTRYKISGVAGQQFLAPPNLPVDAKTDTAIHDPQVFANPIGNEIITPEFADVHATAFFSTVTSSGVVVSTSLNWNANASSVSC